MLVSPSLSFQRSLLTLVILQLYFQAAFSATAACNLAVTDQDINAETTYQITYTASDSSNLNYIYVWFPKDIFPVWPSSVTCTGSSTYFLGSNPNCKIRHGQYSDTTKGWYIVAGNIVKNVGTYTFTIDTIQNSYSEQSTSLFENPDTGNTEVATCHGYETTSTTVDYNIPLILSGGKFTATALSSVTFSTTGSSQNGVLSVLTVEIEIADDFKANGFIQISFPKQTALYEGFGLATSSDSFIFDCSGACTETITSVTVQFSSTGGTDYCSSFTSSKGVNFDLITIETDVTSDIPAGDIITVTLDSIFNPPSLQPITSGFTVQTLDEGGVNVINVLDSGMSLSTSLAGDFSTGGLITIAGSTTVFDDSSYTFSIINTNPIPELSYIEIVLPAEVAMSTAAPSMTCSLSCVGGSASYTGADVYGGTLTITNLFTGVFDYLAPSNTIEFTVQDFINPDYVSQFSFTITSYEDVSGTAYAIDTITTLYIEPDLGVLTITSILPTDSDLVYDLPTSYTVTIESSVDMITSTVLMFVFPAEFEVQDETTCTTDFSTSYTCTPDASSNTIYVYPAKSVNKNKQLTFTVDQIKNPGTFDQTADIEVWQLTSALEQQAYGTYSIAENYFQTSSIEAFTVTTSNNDAGEYPTTYTFTVRPRATMPRRSYLVITFPEDLQIPSTRNIERYCGDTTLSGFEESSISCFLSSSEVLYTVKDGFKSSDSTSDPPTMKFSVEFVKNPRSTEETAPFNVSIYTKGKDLLYQWNYTDVPTVQMTGAASPLSISFSRDNTRNGDTANYFWVINNNNYYDHGDQLELRTPNQLYFSVNTTCIGVNNLKEDLGCEVNSDLGTLYGSIDTEYRRRLATSTIPGGSYISINITQISNPSSYRPTTSSFEYYLYTANGFLVEQQTSGLTVTNSLPGQLSSLNSAVIPTDYDYGAYVDYRLTFSPINFENSMYVVLTIPEEIEMQEATACTGESGTDAIDLTCTTDTSQRKIKITNAFTRSHNSPSSVQILIKQLKNPSTKLITSSFAIETFTYDDYKMDEIETNLTVNFICDQPCKSCDGNNNSYCYSCYTTELYKYYFQATCLDSCPATYYADSKNISCENCTSPCLWCQNGTDICTLCITGYILNGTTCIQLIDDPDDPTVTEDDYFSLSFIYPWPFLVATVVLTIIVLVSIIIRKETRFRESALAMVAWPEYFSWVALIVLQYFEHGVDLNMILMMAGVGSQMVLNVLYGVAHQKIILPVAEEDYRTHLQDHPKCSICTLLFSFIFTFKFHHIMLSFFANKENLSGDFNYRAWQVWNFFALGSILFSYGPVGYGSIMEILNEEYRDSILWYLSIEVFSISTYVAILLLVGMCRKCVCCFREGRKKVKGGNREEKYDEIRAENSSNFLEQSSFKGLKKGVQEDEEDIEVGSKHRKKIIYREDLDDEEEEEYEKRRAGRFDREYRDEVDKLAQLTELLKNQTELHIQEKKQILLERERLLQDKDNNSREFENFKTILRDERDSIVLEKNRLNNYRSEFLDEVDKRVKQRLEDWEMQSMHSMTTLAKKLRAGEAQEESVQTFERMNEVPFKVEVGYETKEELLKRLAMGERHSPRGFQRTQEPKMGAIQEEDTDSDMITQNMKEADEVIMHQEAGTSVRSSFDPVNAAYGKAKKREIEMSKEQDVNLSKQSEISIMLPRAYNKQDSRELHEDQQMGTFNTVVSLMHEEEQLQQQEEIQLRSPLQLPRSVMEREQDEVSGRESKEASIQLPSVHSGAYFKEDQNVRSLRESKESFINLPRPLKGSEEEEKDDLGKRERRREESQIILPEANLEQDLSSIQRESKEVCIQQKPLPANETLEHSLEQDQEEIVQNEEEQPFDFEEELAGDGDKGALNQEKKEYDDLEEIKMNDEKNEDANGYAKEADIEAQDLEKKDYSKKKAKKKVLYSDKSESSVDEMMEDTPSNYNIPNGRLDGKSMGIKSILLFAKKQGYNIPLGSDLQLDTIKELQQKNMTPNILNQNRLGDHPKLHQEEEKKFVNNLFKDGKQKPGDKNLSVPRQPDRNSYNFDSGNEGSWRAFNQPMNKNMAVVGNNEQFENGGNAELLENKKKKKKVVNTQKKFKEPPPNLEKMKALESAYVGSQRQTIEASSTQKLQEGALRSARQGKAILPAKIGGGLNLEPEDKTKLMKNNYL